MYASIAKFLLSTNFSRLNGKAREVVIAALLSFIFYQNFSDKRWLVWVDTIPYLKAELSEQVMKNNISARENNTLIDIIDVRNTEIRQWQTLTREIEEESDDLQDALLDINRTTALRIRDVEQQIIEGECTGAFEFLRKSVPELQFSEQLRLGDDK